MDSKLISYWSYLSKDNSDNTLEFKREKKLSKPTSNSFELKPNGQFIQYEVSSDGKTSATKGRYVVQDNLIYVNFDDPYKDFIFSIISNDNKSLRVRR